MKISEQFYSIQGEGASQGTPSYFVRLQGCNLMCGGSNGKLLESDEASWYCDTEDVWKHGVDTTNEELLNRITQAGQLENVLSGQTHLIWTGGEPMMPRNIKDIAEFNAHIAQYFLENKVYNEIETNGTFTLGNHGTIFNQINCSPKLANSGMGKERRINPLAIESIRDHPNSWFKFVITKESDVGEIELDYVVPFKINKERVIIMPGVDTREDLADMTRLTYEVAMKTGYRAITRGHILAWDKRTGV
jgi:7-carboxy-7-deazaguanine synthase